MHAESEGGGRYKKKYTSCQACNIQAKKRKKDAFVRSFKVYLYAIHYKNCAKST